MIRNIVFDLSNVLTPFRLKEFLAEKGFEGAMAKRIIKASVFTPYWDIFEKGLMTTEEVLRAFADSDPEIADQIMKAYSDVHRIMGKYDYAEGWVKALKKAGYRVYFLTNFTPAGYAQCSDCITFTAYMDGGLYSFQEHITKPDPEIYRRLIDRYGISPEESVFIDDTEENVKTAISLGFHGIIFGGYRETVEKLAELGVKTDPAETEIGGNYEN